MFGGSASCGAAKHTDYTETVLAVIWFLHSVVTMTIVRYACASVCVDLGVVAPVVSYARTLRLLSSGGAGGFSAQTCVKQPDYDVTSFQFPMPGSDLRVDLWFPLRPFCVS